MNYGRIDMKEFEQFRLFLVENDVLDRYIKYAYIERAERKYVEHLYIKKSIDWAFMWRDTEEGQTFWNELDNKWRVKCAAENISCICTVESVVDYLRNDIELWED